MIKPKFLTLIFSYLFLLSTSVQSQISTNERPFSEVSHYTKTVHQTKVNIPIEVMPSINLTKLQKEDEADEVNGIPPRFGKDFNVNFNLTNSGYLETLPNGDRLWRLTIKAPGARSINITERYKI